MPELGDKFLIGRGAPFYELQRQLGLLTEHRQNLPLRAAIFMALAAGVPLLIALATRGPGDFLAMLTHVGFLARFVLFVGICFLMESRVEQQIRDFLVTFGQSGLLMEDGRQAGARAVAEALARRDSAPAEAACAILAAALCLYLGATHHGQSAAAWMYTGADGGGRPTPAGWWVLTVSNGLFWFLFLRWVWRIVVWGMLLRKLARLDLRLVATHPDGYGGIGFLMAYPNAFAPFVFGISAVLAAALYYQLAGGQITTQLYGQLMTVWLALVLIAFSLPLLVFRRPLTELRDRTLIRADRLATRIERAKERHVFGQNILVPGDRDDESAAPPDPAAFRKAAKSLSTMPISRRALVPLGAAALVPLLIAGATLLPLKDLLKAAKTLIVL
jgi:hypothetical protein